jgi:hypothetical protein
VDFTVTNALSADNYPLVPDTAARHLKRAEEQKKLKEGPACNATGWGMHPAAYSHWGAMGPMAKTLLVEVSKRVANDLPHAAQPNRVGEIRQNLSITLAREVARQLSLRSTFLPSC